MESGSDNQATVHMVSESANQATVHLVNELEKTVYMVTVHIINIVDNHAAVYTW